MRDACPLAALVTAAKGSPPCDPGRPSIAGQRTIERIIDSFAPRSLSVRAGRGRRTSGRPRPVMESRPQWRPRKRSENDTLTSPMQDRAETRRNPNDEGSRPRSMPPRTAFSRSARAPAALHPPSSDCAMSPPCSTRSSVRRVPSTSSGLRHGRDGRRGLADSDLDVPAEPVEAPALPHRAHARGR